MVDNKQFLESFFRGFIASFLLAATLCLSSMPAMAASVTMTSESSDAGQVPAVTPKTEASEKTRTTDTQAASCPKPAGKPVNSTFRDLNNVGLYIWLPEEYRTAFECHGKEEECLNNNGAVKDFPEKRQEIKNHLFETYKAYPRPLHPDTMARIFQERITSEIMPYVTPKEDCKVPSPVILDGRKNQSLFDKDAKAVTITVGLQILETTKPRIALLSIDFYRYYSSTSDCARQTHNLITAIPLDLPDNEIATLLANFVNRIKVTNTLAFE